MRIICAAAALALTLAACGGDDDGDDGGTGPDLVTLDGTWTLAIPTLAGSGLSCSATGMTMTLAMSTGTAFAGSHTSGILACDGQDPVEFTPGPILNGTLDDHAVAFDFDDANFHFVGSLNNSETSLTGTNTADLGGGTVLNGTWTATQQNAVRASAPANPTGSSLRELLIDN